MIKFKDFLNEAKEDSAPYFDAIKNYFENVKYFDLTDISVKGNKVQLSFYATKDMLYHEELFDREKDAKILYCQYAMKNETYLKKIATYSGKITRFDIKATKMKLKKLKSRGNVYSDWKLDSKFITFDLIIDVNELMSLGYDILNSKSIKKSSNDLLPIHVGDKLSWTTKHSLSPGQFASDTYDIKLEVEVSKIEKYPTHTRVIFYNKDSGSMDWVKLENISKLRDVKKEN